MADKQRYRLKLSRLDFISPVDTPAQETATVCLIKRQGGERVAITARVTKVDEGLGLVFGWAFTSQVDGADYFDLQGDAIDNEFVKAAADFMQGGALTDEMHDSQPDGRVVFAMPMTPEIAKAFGVVSKTMGLMVALKPSAEVLAKFKSGEYTGFSIAGEGERTTVKSARAVKAAPKFKIGDRIVALVNHMDGMKGQAATVKVARNGTPPYYGVRFDDQKAMPGLHKWLAEDEIEAAPATKRFRKEAVLTSETDGHVHAIDLDDPATAWTDVYSTSYQNAEGADGGHSHSWTFDEAGTIAIGADSGHTHSVTSVVPPDVLAAYAALDAANDAENARVAAAPVAVLDDPSDGIPMLATDEESSGKVQVVVVQSRAPQRFSTPQQPLQHGEPTTRKSQMPTEQEKQIADLTKRNTTLAAVLAAVAAMPLDHRAHFAKMAPADAEGFALKSATERDAAIAATRGGEVYKSERLGRTFYATDDQTMVAMAKDADSQAVELAKSRDEVEKAAVRKQAAEHLGKIAGGDDVHDFIIRSCRKSGDPVMLAKALEAMKGWNELGAEATKAKGVNPGSDATGGEEPFVALEKGLTAFAKTSNITKNVWTDGLAAFVKTEHGAALKRAYDESIAG